ncbi:unnamed protein product [Prorocentrum cordatum]|uniref:Beta-galactosidase n=1 Tax=Prorocentrum cordatum TaxID=2364126 RepID=A0ABN9VGK2_9DINO|nr:unnamed protein product [Polarella glacialis]
MNTIVAIQLKPSAERADGEMTNTPTVGEMTATPTHVKSMTPCQRTETMQMFAFEDHLLGWPSDPRSPVLPLFGGWGARMATVPTPGADLRQRSRKTTHDNGRLLADAEHSASSPSGSSTRFAVAASEASRHSAVSRISETSLENELSSTEHHWVVQVLVPQPGKRLLVVASSVRVFNYTGRPLYLNYAGNGVQFGGFSEQLVAAATARIDLLGAEQSKLGLSAASVAALLQGPLEEDRGLTGTQASTPDGDDFLWRLPPLHFASPPVPQDAAFRISLTSRISRGGQSQTINPAELARRCESGEWRSGPATAPRGAAWCTSA